MPSWMYFVLALAGLLAGYCVYGAIVEKVFGPDPNRPTPACKMPDGVDYVEMSPTKVFLIQLLNIAGLGPVFGPILGALYGPIALLWVVIGCVFAGAVHDYFSGMLSVRYNGKSVPDIVGYNLGDLIKKLMRVFAVVLLILVGVVFVAGPAGLLSQLTGMHSMLFVAIIFAYYFLATILPVDKIIGRIYPFFAVLLVFMAVGLLSALAFKGYTFYSNIEWTMHSPSGLPAWPLVFITIACGACSGFHATQSPLMARCINNEKHGRKIFYGAMIAEGVIGLIWVTLGMSFYSDTAALAAALGPKGNAALVVNNISVELLGVFGGALAVLGVVVLPVTSGDTAFRSARLVLADWFHIEQKSIKGRLTLCIPVLGIGAILGVGNALGKIDYTIIWRYFSWTNQTLAMIVLWAASMYLFYEKKNYWITAVPATFMSAVSITYFMLGNECLGQFLNHKTADGAVVYNTAVAYPVGIIAAALFLGIFLYSIKKRDVKPQYETLGK